VLTAEGSDVTVEAIVDQDGHGYLLASDLPALSSDQTYQLWGVVNDTVISLGILGRSPEIESFSVEGDLSALVITEEVAGGVAVSEQPALLVAEI
jgi:anti-sigma-K factor RskA